MRSLLAVSLLAIYLVFSSQSAFAQEPLAKDLAPVTAQQKRLASLQQVLSSLQDDKQELKRLQQELTSTQGRGREEQITDEIKKLGKQVKSLERSFEQIAAGNGLIGIETKQDEEVSWTQELHLLLQPLFNELKRATTRPREIDEYRREIEDLQGTQDSISKGLEALSELIKSNSDKALGKALIDLQKEWQEKSKSNETQLSIAQQNLDRLLSERGDVISSAKEVFNLFFHSRGRNLFIGLLSATLFFMAIRRFHNLIQRLPRVRARKKSFQTRLVNVAFLFASGLGTVIVFVLVLFLLEDWVLVTLAVMFLLGIAWSSKQVLGRFFGQATLLLNVGSVREGERVVVGGVPWKVETLNLYSVLSNPELDGGRLRLPVRDLMDLRSRRRGSDEPWFASRKDDWVLLADGTFGRVVSQGVDLVVVESLGGSRKSYLTADYLEQSPEVLSAGFRSRVRFGVDYQHQALVTSEVPAKLEQSIEVGLNEAGFAAMLKNLSVQFAEAGASSLDLDILADFSGEAAQSYQKLGRLLQRLCVDTCNSNGWVIPFQQITLHVASEAST